MKDNLVHFSLRTTRTILDKLGYIAAQEERTKNKEIEQLIKRHIAEFEATHGKIELPRLSKER